MDHKQIGEYSKFAKNNIPLGCRSRNPRVENAVVDALGVSLIAAFLEKPAFEPVILVFSGLKRQFLEAAGLGTN